MMATSDPASPDHLPIPARPPGRDRTGSGHEALRHHHGRRGCDDRRGIFALTGIAAGQAGPALLLAFALNGVLTLCTAMVYAEVGNAIPAAGGGYLWARFGLRWSCRSSPGGWTGWRTPSPVRSTR